MRPIRVTVSAQEASNPIPMDHYREPFNVSIGVAVTGTLTYTVEHTFDDVFADGYDPDAGSSVWFANDAANLQGASTSQEGNYAFPVTAIRLNVSGYTSGSATMTLIQAGGGN